MSERSLLQQVDVEVQARRAARAAADRAGVTVAELRGLDELDGAAELIARIWGAPKEDPLITSNLLRALSHAGGFVAGARVDGRLVAASVGFTSLEDGQPGLHSHISGVHPEVQGRSAGFALKQYQRAWALARGIDRITWTYDPLVGRNAYFNLTKLGATVTAFHRNFYGALSDGMNAGDETDRCLVTWHLSSERTILASEGRAAEPDVDEIRDAGAVVALDEGPDGAPVPGPADGRVRLCRTPRDILELRGTSAELGRTWRRAVRRVIESALEDGLVATGATRTGWYVFEERR